MIVLRIQPDEGMTVTLATKLPGMEMQTGTVHMVFNYESGFGVRTAAAYETLLLDALQGDATLFTRRDETEAEWRLITPILEAWAQQTPPSFPNYPAGSDGPRVADELLARARTSLARARRKSRRRASSRRACPHRRRRHSQSASGRSREVISPAQ